MSLFFGSKPDVPKLPGYSLEQGAADASAANLAALPQEEKVASQVNLFNQEQINKMYEGAGFDLQGIGKLASAGITRELSGQLSLSDVAQRELGSVAASFGGGYAGSPMQGNRVARDLGLTEQQLFGTGLSQAEQWMKSVDSIYAPGMMNVAAMQFTPQQGVAHGIEERNAQWQRQYLQNQIHAMPDPTAAGILNTTMSFISSIRGGGAQTPATNPSAGVSAGGFGGGGEGSPYGIGESNVSFSPD